MAEESVAMVTDGIRDRRDTSDRRNHINWGQLVPLDLQ